MAGLFVKKGDTVQVISGKDRGLKGKVLQAHPDSSRILVEGANRIKKHTRVTQSARGSQQGGAVARQQHQRRRHRLEGIAKPYRHQDRHAHDRELGGGIQRGKAGHGAQHTRHNLDYMPAQTTAQRQQAFKEAQRAAGMVRLEAYITAEQREKFRVLGGDEWLRKKISAAKLPKDI